MRCPRPDHADIEFDELAALVVHLIQHVIDLENTMTSNQEHLDTDITALTDAFGSLETVITGLKSQPGAENLDFTAADALVASVQAAVTSDQPPVVPVDPSAPADGSTPAA